jgi:hypothetical protein
LPELELFSDWIEVDTALCDTRSGEIVLLLSIKANERTSAGGFNEKRISQTPKDERSCVSIPEG